MVNKPRKKTLLSLIEIVLFPVLFSFEIFIENKREYCVEFPWQCDGTRMKPFGTIIQGLIAIEKLSDQIIIERSVTIFVEGNEGIHPYLILSSDFPSSDAYSPFSFLEGNFFFYIAY